MRLAKAVLEELRPCRRVSGLCVVLLIGGGRSVELAERNISLVNVLETGSAQTLLYAGSIMKDDDSLQDYKVPAVSIPPCPGGKLIVDIRQGRVNESAHP
jgi:hypothetical protein